jgi:hypothetical protein
MVDWEVDIIDITIVNVDFVAVLESLDSVQLLRTSGRLRCARISATALR